MFKKDVIGLEEARRAVDAALAEASKEPHRPVAVAVVDDHGDLVYFARMDGAHPLFGHMAINKAYTAARMMMDTATLADVHRERGFDLATWGDGKLTLMRGGQVILKPGDAYIPGPTKQGIVLGGIGSSGRLAIEDEKVAVAGWKALNL